MSKICPICIGTGDVSPSVNHERECDFCSGKGKVKGYKKKKCEICDGLGYVIRTCSTCGGKGEFFSLGIHYSGTKPCRDCNFSGKEQRPCYNCKGGYIYELDDSACFITTATLKYLGHDIDNCQELEVFRQFRDKYVVVYYPKLVKEYYDIAPTIVKQINLTENMGQIYELVWNNYLSIILIYIKRFEYRNALDIYIDMIHFLKNNYGL